MKRRKRKEFKWSGFNRNRKLRVQKQKEPVSSPMFVSLEEQQIMARLHEEMDKIIFPPL